MWWSPGCAGRQEKLGWARSCSGRSSPSCCTGDCSGQDGEPFIPHILVPPKGLLPCIYAVILSFLHILVSQNGLLLCILPVRDHDSISLWSVLQAHHHRCELTLCRSLQEKHLTNFYRFQQKEKRRSGEHRPPRLSILFPACWASYLCD